MIPDRIEEIDIHRAKTDPRINNYINIAFRAAQNSERNTGIPAAITIAQAIIESSSGLNHGGKANNYFGIKAPMIKGKRSIGPIATGCALLNTKEEIDGVLINKPGFFRTYLNMEDSFEDHGIWIKTNPRFSIAVADYLKSGDADQFAKELAINKYATASNYAIVIIGIMKKYNLYQYNLRKPRLTPR